MSAFWVKNVLRKAVLTDNFSYNKASDIYDYLIKHFQQDPQKKCFFLESETIYPKQFQKKACYTKNCGSHHMICVHPDGSVQTKQNICSCHNCIQVEFITCIEERGSFLHNRQVADKSSDSSESDEEIESDDIDCEEGGDMDRYEMSANSVIEIIQKDNIIVLFSPPESLEPFYLCKVIEVGVATKRIVDKPNYSIESGSHYIKCQYLEKIKEWKSTIKYKLLPDAVYVFLTQVTNPLVALNENFELSIKDYQWLSDSL